MIETVPIEVFLTATGALSVAGRMIWKDLNEKIKVLQNDVTGCPMPSIKTDIALIKQDIGWIKEKLKAK